MAKYTKCVCAECGERDFCRSIDGDPVCLECLDSWGGDGGVTDADMMRDQLEYECHSDADGGL